MRFCRHCTTRKKMGLLLGFFAGILGTRNLEVRLHNDSVVALSWSRISTDTSCDGLPSDYRVQWKRANQTYNNVEYVKQSSYYICGE